MFFAPDWAPVVPPQKVRLDPPGTHPSPTFCEGMTGALGDMFQDLS